MNRGKGCIHTNFTYPFYYIQQAYACGRRQAEWGHCLHAESVAQVVKMCFIWENQALMELEDIVK